MYMLRIYENCYHNIYIFTRGRWNLDTQCFEKAENEERNALTLGPHGSCGFFCLRNMVRCEKKRAAKKNTFTYFFYPHCNAESYKLPTTDTT